MANGVIARQSYQKIPRLTMLMEKRAVFCFILIIYLKTMIWTGKRLIGIHDMCNKKGYRYINKRFTQEQIPRLLSQ